MSSKVLNESLKDLAHVVPKTSYMVDFVVTFSKWSFSAVSKQFPMKFKYVSDPWLYFRFLYSKVVYFCYNGSIFNDYLVPQFEKSIKKNSRIFLGKKSGHQYRFKISLRIEWDHSQPLKITLKYSNLHPKKVLVSHLVLTVRILCPISWFCH